MRRSHNNVFYRVKMCGKVMTIILLLAIMLSSVMVFSGCEKKIPDPVYEIKLYDDNWKELEKKVFDNTGSYSYTYGIIYEYEQDGEVKCFNAIAYRNGVEFYKFDYNNPEFYKDRIIDLSINNRTVDIKRLPKEKGEYSLSYSFVWRSAYDLPDLFKGESFPMTLKQDVIIHII